MSDPRIAWCDIYLRAIDLRCGNVFREPELEGLELLMMIAREEIEAYEPPVDDNPVPGYIG